MSVVVVCDHCGSHEADRYYLSVAIGRGKGTRNVAKGDLCIPCLGKLPLTPYEPSRKNLRGPRRPQAVAA